MSACTYVRAFACIPVCMRVCTCVHMSQVCVVSACACVVSTAPCGCCVHSTLVSTAAEVACRNNTQPTIVVACLEVLTAALREVVDVKQPKTVPAQLEHEDKMVREDAKVLAVEMVALYRPSAQDRLGGTCYTRITLCN